MTEKTGRSEVRFITVPVRELLEFSSRSGDLLLSTLPVLVMEDRALAGIEGHQRVQRARPEGYEAEVALSYAVHRGRWVFQIKGRADGIFRSEGKPTAAEPQSEEQQRTAEPPGEEEQVVIDEIKTTTRPPGELSAEDRPLHWAQAKIYAYIYARQNLLNTIGVQLTYYCLPSGEQVEFRRFFSLDELSQFFEETVSPYLRWLEQIYLWRAERDEVAARLPFPYPAFRAGQEELAEAVSEALERGEQLFAQAPTGIGKTMAVLWPSLRALGRGAVGRLLYLTARTTGRLIAEEALAHLRQSGLKARAVTLTAKEKICFQEEVRCDPEFCPYAAGHFDRLNQALEALFAHEALTRSTLEEVAREQRVCPFELSLEAALWADVLICDYNYVFDPRVQLRRLLDAPRSDYALLMDEAHNLVDRAREMFSAELLKQEVLALRRAVKAYHPALTQSLSAVNSFLLEKGRLLPQENKKHLIETEPPVELESLLGEVLLRSLEALHSPLPPEVGELLLDFYFATMRFWQTLAGYDKDDYVTFYEGPKSALRLKLYCLDPSRLLGERLRRTQAAVAFSATLSPLDYFRDILGGKDSSSLLSLPSPFPPENLCLLLADRIATTYRLRQTSYDSIARALGVFTSLHPGNYLVYFPSYAYLQEVLQRFLQLPQAPRTLVQQPLMSEEERQQFLDSFALPPQETLVGFAVLGGFFGEAVDLLGERLIGVSVVGVGLPQVCLERDLIRQHFDETKKQGFAYAYQYPGMQRVLQAAGRLIRSEKDRGVLLLIDQRFAQRPYKDLLPPWWPPRQPVRTPNHIRRAMTHFWTPQTEPSPPPTKHPPSP